VFQIFALLIFGPADHGQAATGNEGDAFNTLVSAELAFAQMARDQGIKAGFLSVLADLACVYGAYFHSEKSTPDAPPDGYFLHIWRLEHDGKWRVALDLLFGVPQSE